MRIHSRYRGQSGFSLIEVMIAVIVLATGLLALAALQINLTSSSADAKARSRIASLLVSTMDDQRASGYKCIPSAMTCSATSCTPAPATGCPAYTYTTAIATAQNEAAVSGLGLSLTSTTVTRYKKIALNATWTDATGGARTLGLNTIASVLTLPGTSSLFNQNLSGSSGTNPVVHQTNPGNTAGVIPIAVGDNGNDKSAATNPKPTINSSGLASTTFNVLTYDAALANNTSSTATIQKRVETTVAQCVCKGSVGNPITDPFLSHNMFRPTYWDGLKYSAPNAVFDSNGTTLTPPYSTNVSSVTQDSLCTVCCRDHHDASTDTVKFDPFTGDLARYKVKTTNAGAVVTPVALALSSGAVPTANGTTNNLVAANMTGDIYLDSCRLIRVDGLWRVAANINAEQVALLQTTSVGADLAKNPAPDVSQAVVYGNFVVDYLGKKLTQILSSGAAPVANTLYASYGLDAPSSIQVTNIPTPTDYRYLHGRGLYLDHLEQPALDKLNSVNSTCASANYPTCLLPYLPFNTINTTELAIWSTVDTSKLVVTTGSQCTTSNPVAPFRGCVHGIGLSTSVNATLSMTPSNSAVTSSSLSVNPYEVNPANTQTDAQAFSVSGTDTASEFFVALTGTGGGLAQVADLSTNDDPFVQWGIGLNFNSDFCQPNYTQASTTPNPYDCLTNVPLALPVNVTLSNYNVATNQAVDNPCSGGSGTFSQPVLTCNTVNSNPSMSGSGLGSGYNITTSVTGTRSAGEQTLIVITAQNAGSTTPIPKSAATLNVTFSPNGSKTAVQNGLGTGYTCDVTTNVPTFTTPTSCN
jgi:prepilin-type N-terminal cleavage/methylation domain-containing protein